MKCAEKPLVYSVVSSNSGKMPVIIVAAGNSTRMQGVNKQLLNIANVPVIVRTVLAFEKCDLISNIIVVCRKEDTLRMEKLFNDYGISKITDIVAGGKTRQESVYNGVNVLDKAEEYVLIHDGARPLVSEEIIREVINASRDFYSVAPGVKIKDTVKMSKNGVTRQTLQRNGLFAIQTPQRVNVKKYAEIIKNSGENQFTDDTSVMESGGYDTLITVGEYRNIKITTAEDVIIAAALLESEKSL